MPFITHHIQVLIFRRRGPPTSPQIRFHLTRTPPLHSILTDCAFSTSHVNIITWDKAYCMFPHLTFINRRMYFLHNPDEALGQILSKYSAHGWRTSDWADYDQTKGCGKPGIRQSIRRIGDSATWTIPLSLHKVRVPNTPGSILEGCTFQIFPESRSQESQHAVAGLKTFSIGAQTFSCCMLEYAYTFHTPDISWCRFLREKLSRMVMLGILKSSDADLIARTRQPDFVVGDHKCCPLLRTMPRFQRPEGWECVDYMVPAWFEEWKMSWRERTGSVDLTPHPLTVLRSKKQPTNEPKAFNLSSPPLLPPPRARSMTTSRMPTKTVPIPPTSAKSEHVPHQSKSPLPHMPPRSKSISVGTTHLPITTRIPAYRFPQCGVVSGQFQSSKSCSQLSIQSQQQTKIPTLNHVRRHLPQITQNRTPSPQKSDYFSLRHRRPKAPVPPPLNLGATGPLMFDLLTPPSDCSLPALPVLKNSPEKFPMQLQHLPLSPFGKKFRIQHAQRHGSVGSERTLVGGEGGWI